MAQHNPFIDAILQGRQPGIMDFLGANQTFPPGITGTQAQAKPKSGIEGLLGNKFLLNILAQQGKSFTPGPGPLGVIGRAGLATQQQQKQQGVSGLQEELLRAKIGLTGAQTNALTTPGGGGKPLTDIAKLKADLAAGRVSQEVFDAERNSVLTKASNVEFANTQKLRGEFINETKDISSSLSSLSAARTLIETDANPIAQFAAFISTIKSIDNSTVREGELRAFEKVQGMRRELDNFLKRAKGEGMTVDLRRDISETINKLQGPLNELLNAKRKFYGNEATRFKLNAESVSGSPFSTFGVAELPGLAENSNNDDPDNELASLKARLAEIEAERAKLSGG